MNKLTDRQKEVIQYELDQEKDVLRQLEKHYQTALNDIDRRIRILESDELTQSKIYRIEYQKALRKQVEATLEKLHADEYATIQGFLSDSYTTGFVGAAYDMFGQGVPLIMPIDQNAAVKAIITDSKIDVSLYESLGVDTTKLKKTITAEITRGIAASLPHSDISRNLANAAKISLGRAKTIVRTESHRIQEASAQDARKMAVSKGAIVVKQWKAIMDGKVRHSHRVLDGQIVEVDEPFQIDGMEAMYPGDFGDPSMDCNCRCRATQRAKIALGKEEYKNLQERARYFGLMEEDSKEFGHEKERTVFSDFKKKYLKANDENTSTSPVPDVKSYRPVPSTGHQEDISALQNRLSDLEREWEEAVSLDDMIRIQEEQDEIHRKISEISKKQQEETRKQAVSSIQDSIASSGLFKNVDLKDVDIKSAHDIYDVAESVRARYPDVELSGLKISGGNMTGFRHTDAVSLGKTTGTQVVFSGEYFKSHDYLETIVKEMHESGFGVSSNTKGIIAHEFGHALGSYYKVKPYEIARSVATELLGVDVSKGVDKKTWDSAMFISRYGDENTDEWFAECFADFMTSPKPHEVSIKAIEVFERMIAKRK